MNPMKRAIPFVVVFITSMGIMIVELVASRIVSKYFGNSLYTWTGVIGVVLGGISLGNYLGGRLADRYTPTRIVSLLLLVTSFFVFSILVLDTILDRIMSEGQFTTVTSSMVIRSFIYIFVLFFLPSTTLGTVSPVMAKYALEESSRVGNTVGSIYATASIGSIFGTFLSGFVLIPLLGIKTIVFVIGMGIALLSLIVRGRRVVSLAWICLTALLYLFFYSDAFESGPLRKSHAVGRELFTHDSQYANIQVRDTGQGEEAERILVMDGLIHNRYNPADPDDLLYEYEKIFSSFTDRFMDLAPEGTGLRTLTLGGGACIFPAYLDRHYPGSINETVEIDPEVINVALKYFDFPSQSRGRVYTCDARSYVLSIRNERKYDLIFLDAFNSFAVPPHLTTREFTWMLRGILKDRGYLVVNCIDIFSIGRFLNAYLNTVSAVFPQVAVFSGVDVASDVRNTFVIIAGNREIELDILYYPFTRSSFQRLSPRMVRSLHNRNGARILTDDHAPVENLIAPVYLHSVF
jgi:MFS family permease